MEKFSAYVYDNAERFIEELKGRNSRCHREAVLFRRSDPQFARWRLLRQKTPRNDTATLFLGRNGATKQSPSYQARRRLLRPCGARNDANVTSSR